MGEVPAILKYLLLTSFLSCIEGVPVIHWISPRYGSLAGGTVVDVYGNGFATDGYTSRNIILFDRVPCTVIQYTSSVRRLQCVTEPYPDAEEGLSYRSRQSSIVTNGEYSVATDWNDRYNYYWSYTPQIRSVLPNSGPVSQLVYLGGSRLSNNYDDYESIHLGDGVCETRNEEDYTHYDLAYYSSLWHIRCRSTEKRAGGWNATMIRRGVYGRTWNHSQSLYPLHDWSLGMYELFPDIHSVSPQMGSVRGGTLVTLTGTGFEVDALSEISVDIDGIPCRVISGTSTEIKCWAGIPPEGSAALADNDMAYPIAEMGYRFRGSRGVNYLQYNGIYGNLQESTKYPDQPDYSSVYPSYSVLPTRLRKSDYYGARFTAFFNPHSSGDHTFVVTNDDQGSVWFSNGTNMTEMNRIINSPRPTGYTNFYRYSEQRADTIHLEQGEDYLLTAELTERVSSDYLQVGVLIHDTNFTYKETQQVVRERQFIELHTAGLYEIQMLQVSINTSDIDESDAPMFIVEWGGRETDLMSLMDLDMLNSTLINLFDGSCGDAFGQELGYTHYVVYNYEDNSSPPWVAWDGSAPVLTIEESFCGRHSLYLEDNRARASSPNSADGVRMSDYPYLCLAYKVPQGNHMAIAVDIKSIGWRSISLSSSPGSPFPNLASFWDYSDDDYLIDDDGWHYACTDLEEMLSSTVNIPQDPENEEGVIQSITVQGFGFYANADGSQNGFFIDEVSFSAEKRTFLDEYYLPPARPNGLSINNITMRTVVTNSTEDVFNYSYFLTIIPATCQADIPLINITLLDLNNTTGVLEFNLTRYQAASEPLDGNYSFSFNSYTTTPIPHDASPAEIKSALEALDSIGEVTVYSLLPLVHDSLGKFCPGRRFRIRFENNRGDLPMLVMETQNLVGDELDTSIREEVKGGLFLRPIPGHMLQTVEKTPQVHVRIRDQLAACGGKNDLYADVSRENLRDYCGFKYGPQATPVVTSILPNRASNGETITISGDGFSTVTSENYVLLGDIDCAVTSSTTNMIECTLSAGYAGLKELYLHVMYSGVAETNGMSITYALSLDSIHPSEGSQEGRTEVTIVGSGFYYSQEESNIETVMRSTIEEVLSIFISNITECPSGWINQVLIGGNPCDVVNSTGTILNIITPATTSSMPINDLEFIVVCPDDPNHLRWSAVLPNAYTYSSALTPSILNLLPTSGSILGGLTVTITGTGFSTSIAENIVLIGDLECVVESSSHDQLICITPPHSQGEVNVSVIVAGKGKASGDILFMYNLDITEISHCSGSIFGGQVISISGSGFGTNPTSVDVDLGGKNCELVDLTNEEIVCVTSAVNAYHEIDNNAMHEEYGLGYSWNPSSLTVNVGDTVHWSWTGSQFATRRSVVQVNGPHDIYYNGVGFRSEQSITGSFNFTFTKPGTYYYISEGYGDIGFGGVVRVLDLEDIVVPINIRISSIPLSLSDYDIQCNDTGVFFTSYTYATSSTPVFQILSERNAAAGASLVLNFEGISDIAENNIFIFGGSTPISCSSLNPPSLSTSQTDPLLRLSPIGTEMYIDSTVECIMPDLQAGSYRSLLHVAGRGWGYASLEDSVIYIYPQILSSPSVESGSLRGGLSLTMQTAGLYPSDIVRTRVTIGNTPCLVQDIDIDGSLSCLTLAAIDDGLSSLISQSSPLAYWSLQTDYYKYNGSYLSSDGSSFFRSRGYLGSRANARVHGLVSNRQAGISGNDKTDQSILFQQSGFLQVPSLEQLFSSASFSMEFWMKLSNTVQGYSVIVNASSFCYSDQACGFLVMFNPCNELEFWVASENNLEELQDRNVTECILVTDSSQCPQACNGYIEVSESMGVLLPSGLWHVVQGNRLDWSDWHHVHISWQPECLMGSALCNGTQTLVIDGEHHSFSGSYLKPNSTTIEMGGCSALPLGFTGVWMGLASFNGYLDEVAFYNRSLSDSEIDDRITYGLRDIQPIWLSVEGMDGVGIGSIPDIYYETLPVLNLETIDWESATNLSRIYNDSLVLQFEWTVPHGVRQVSREVFESCDLESDFINQWSPNVRQSKVNIPLEKGERYYFIDSVAGGCLDGRKLSVQVGNVRVIEWRVGKYEDITISESSGLIFQWSGSYHNLLEMSSPVDNECTFVGVNSFKLGQVKHGWLRDPANSGEVIVNGLSIGQHHFACSVGDHCQQGMSFTVTVESGEGDISPQDAEQETYTVHTIHWLIRDYDDLMITEGDTVSFTWEGFHSLHQVTEDTFTLCNTSHVPLHVWGEPSVDNRADIGYLSPGTYYFICSVAGHCSAGMKIKVIVIRNDVLPVLSNPVSAECSSNNISCSFSYSADSAHTPRLNRINPVSLYPLSALTLYGQGLIPPNATVGDMVDDSVDVWIGNTLCTDVMVAAGSSPTEDIISCTAPNYESKYYYVIVHVQEKGFASVGSTVPHPGMIHNSSLPAGSESVYPHVFIMVRVNSVSPDAGSILGGSEVTIRGSGFSLVNERMSARIGDIPCAITFSSHSEIRCITGPSNSEVTLPISVTVNDFSLNTNIRFTYSLVRTPILSDLSVLYPTGGEDITISGSMFGMHPQVQVTSIVEGTEEGGTDDECALISYSDTEINCTLPFKSAGEYQVVVVVENLGVAMADADGGNILTYSLMVDNFSPTMAGHGGGIVLTVNGHGFPTLSGEQNSIDNIITVTLCDVPCSIIDSSLTVISCTLSRSRREYTHRSCNVTVAHNNVVSISEDQFDFVEALTPTLTSITPSVGGTAGGTRVILRGSGFLPPGSEADDLEVSDVTVNIDGVMCEWVDFTVNATEITCRTSLHRTSLKALVEVLVHGKGRAFHEDPSVTFEYVDLWSSEFTWGGNPLPGFEESVYIKSGQTIFLDISPPVLNLLLIEGSLIFEDNQDLHLQAKYIFINNGTFQVGTEDSPFQHQATITLHGNILDPEIPVYGAKVLGVRQGNLDLHGRPRQVTWTRLAATALANGTSLTLQQEVDWVVGDRIVIAPTGKNGNETEERIISRVSMDKRTVELDRALNFTHHGITETMSDGNFIEIRAEVGLLSHNVIVQGALLPDTDTLRGLGGDQYGAQIFIHRMGPHPTPIRIEHTEVRHSGQAFRLGRYSIHFHLSGSMNGSYIRHCSIHHTFNRAITAHGVHDLLIEGNVAYDVKGHTYFIEDGVETNNRYLYNLGVLTRGSSSLLNTDQLPATFWITNPQNTFIGNAAVASRAYGFWYDLDNFPSGASFSRSICPNKSPFGEFSNNTAHTCNEFGLRIWEKYIPYVDGCGSTEHGEATLYDLTTYGNGIHGVELSVVGHVRLSGFKIADNVDNGIEIQETVGEWGGSIIMNSLIISHTSVNDGEPQTGGIKTPNTPKLTISNVTFARFDQSSTSCLRACSQCKVRQGGFEVWFQQLQFIDGSEEHKTSFQWEFEVLYRDLDGTLTGLPGGGWIVPDSGLVPDDHCTLSVPAFSGNSMSFNGTVCNDEVKFLRMAWNNAMPLSTLRGVSVNVTNQFSSAVVPWRHYRLTHTDGYMFTMPQGYDHTITWLLPLTSRVDTSSYSAGVYGVTQESQLWISHQFVNLPDHVSIGENNIITNHGEEPTEEDENYSWFINNQTNIVTYLINGENLTSNANDDISVTFTYSYEPCPPDGCPPPGIDYGDYESTQRRWSDPGAWPRGSLPLEGEDVTISSKWRMLVDISPPSLGNVYVFGELMFEDEQDYNFTASVILILGNNSRMIVGTEQSPFTHHVTLTLTGRREDESLALGRGVILGSKAIGVFGNLSLHGVARASTWTRLETSAYAGNMTITLPESAVSSWNPGDEIVIAPSGYDPMESDIRTIASVDGGVLTLTEALDYDHLIHNFLDSSDLEDADPPSTVDGANPWWGDGGALAPEVGLFTRNIVIQGGEDPEQPLEEHHYGCRILIGKYTDRGYTYTGRLKMDSVEIQFCGQGGYFSHRDPRYSIAFRNSFGSSVGSYVRRCSIHHGYNTAIGVHTSNGVSVSDNVIWRTTDSSIKVGGSSNMIANNLAMMTATVQPNRPPDSHAVDFPATYDVDSGNTVRGNAAAGSMRLSFQYAGESCLEGNVSPLNEEAMFWNNTAHSGLIGLNIQGIASDCTSIGGFTSMYHWNYAVFSSTASSLIATHLKIAVGKVGLNLNVFGPNPVAHYLGNKFIRVADSLIVGSIPGESCITLVPPFFVSHGVSFVAEDHKLGIMMASFNQKRSKMDGTGAWHLFKGYPVIDGVLNTSRISFARFTSSQSCSYGIYAVGNNPLSPDAVHPMQMTGTNKYNVDLDSLAFFYEPKLGWIVQEDCVDMDCDGPKHAMIRDIDGRFVSTQPVEGSIIPIAELRFANYSSRIPMTWLASDGPKYGVPIASPGEVVENMGIARGTPNDFDSEHGGCELRTAWQAYRCKTLQHHMFVIESLDADTETRRLSPLALNGGDVGAGSYTDLINGPMDHGWCTYYTCLKRLSTFFTIVAEGSDYCVWMTGSPPSTLRFHLLNAGPDDAIKMCMWFKTTQRKDVYKNGVFIEPENVQYHDGAILQTDGDYIPTRERFGGANYFDRETHIMHLIIKGSDPIEIRTPPVIQISISLAVSIDDFFDIGELIDNLAFVLKIDKNKIRVVKIVSEDSKVRSGRSLLSTSSFNRTSITLEFGNPPAPNITLVPPPSVAEEITTAREINDSVDLTENTVLDAPLSGSNPLNEDPPETTEEFVTNFNESAIGYLDEIESYELILNEVEETNSIGEEFINLILTGETDSITNATVLGVSAVPALPPPSPQPPVIPPTFQNISNEEGDPMIIVIDEMPEMPTLVVDVTNETNNEINFVIPSSMRVTLEPQQKIGHLVHVRVTIYDSSDNPVINLGLVNPWMCEASLIPSRRGSAATLGGITSVPFVRGVAEFTRLRVDQPDTELTLSFQTNPARFVASTSVRFTVVAPPSNTLRTKLGFTLSGDLSSLPSDSPSVVDFIREGLSLALDVDISRIDMIEYNMVSASGEIMIEFDLLDKYLTDPPDVPSLSSAIALLEQLISESQLRISINNEDFMAASGSFEYVTMAPPIRVATTPNFSVVAISMLAGSFVLVLIFLIVLVIIYRCTRKEKREKNKKKSGMRGRGRISPLIESRTDTNVGVRDEPNLWSGGETGETRGVDSQNTQSNSNSLSHIEQTNSSDSELFGHDCWSNSTSPPRTSLAAVANPGRNSMQFYSRHLSTNTESSDVNDEGGPRVQHVTLLHMANPTGLNSLQCRDEDDPSGPRVAWEETENDLPPSYITCTTDDSTSPLKQWNRHN